MKKCCRKNKLHICMHSLLVFQLNLQVHCEWSIEHLHLLQWCPSRGQVHLCQLWHPGGCDRSHRHPALLLPVWLCRWGNPRLHSKGGIGQLFLSSAWSLMRITNSCECSVCARATKMAWMDTWVGTQSCLTREKLAGSRCQQELCSV